MKLLTKIAYASIWITSLASIIGGLLIASFGDLMTGAGFCVVFLFIATMLYLLSYISIEEFGVKERE